MSDPKISSLSGLVVAIKESAETDAAQKADNVVPTLSAVEAAKVNTDIKIDPTVAALAISLKGILTLAVFTLYAARISFIPIVVAVLLFFLLSPVVRAISRKLRVGRE